jgi:hypothetical protein
MLEGWRLLSFHRLNYNSQGAQRLEIMRWEWPPEYRESIRFGGSMNFMETPNPGLEENGKINESQLKIAVDFVTELVSLGVLALVLFTECVPPFLSCKTWTARSMEMYCRY